jgi:hypothetical protein
MVPEKVRMLDSAGTGVSPSARRPKGQKLIAKKPPTIKVAFRLFPDARGNKHSVVACSVRLKRVER